MLETSDGCSAEGNPDAATKAGKQARQTSLAAAFMRPALDAKGIVCYNNLGLPKLFISHDKRTDHPFYPGLSETHLRIDGKRRARQYQ
jgi:hypothetical protein